MEARESEWRVKQALAWLGFTGNPATDTRFAATGRPNLSF